VPKLHTLATQQFGTLHTKYGNIINQHKAGAIIGRFCDSIKKWSEIPGLQIIPPDLLNNINNHEYGDAAYFVLAERDQQEIKKFVEKQWDEYRK